MCGYVLVLYVYKNVVWGEKCYFYVLLLLKEDRERRMRNGETSERVTHRGGWVRGHGEVYVRRGGHDYTIMVYV